MTQRLTVEDVRKAFSDYYGIPHEYRQKVHDSAERALANYQEMLEKARHSLADLAEAMEGLIENQVQNMADPEDTSRIEWDIREARGWVERLAGDIAIGTRNEEERL